MKISTNIGFVSHTCGDKEAIQILAEAGFDAVDYSFGTLTAPIDLWLQDDYAHRAKELLDCAHAKGMYFNQAHAPLPITASGQNTMDALKNVSYERMERVFEICKLMEIPHIIVHGMRPPAFATEPEKMFQFNLDYFRKLKEVAEPHGVRIAVENLYKTFSSPDNLGRVMVELNDDYFMACVDVGHCNIVNSGSGGMIRRLGSRVQALHIHDNHVDYDEHLLPGFGTADWEDILNALAEVGYRGEFTLEASDHSCSCMRSDAGFDASFFPVALRYAQQTARYLADKLERKLAAKA